MGQQENGKLDDERQENGKTEKTGKQENRKTGETENERDGQQETGDRRQERQKMREMDNGRWETGDGRQEMGDRRIGGQYHSAKHKNQKIGKQQNQTMGETGMQEEISGGNLGTV
ncbi:hypothetical protein EDD22DRAFT_849820 [Suillus occidentalis]|nr:hypothetical protein EDD22DRAFT_849820 [Suillus occidentalis]